MEMIKYQDNTQNNLGDYYQEWLNKLNLQKFNESSSTSSEDEEDETSQTLGACASLNLSSRVTLYVAQSIWVEDTLCILCFDFYICVIYMLTKLNY